MPGLGDLIGILLKPLELLFSWLSRVTGFSNEPVLRIAVNHIEWAPGELDHAGIIVENVGHSHANATRRAHDIRVRCRVDQDGPFDLYWEGIPPVLTSDLLEDEPKGLAIAYRWPGPGYFDVDGVHLASGVSYLADGSLELQHALGMVLPAGQHALEVVCHYDETGRARARFTLTIPEPDDHETLLVLGDLN